MALGYDVRSHRYDDVSAGDKVYNKVRHELPAKIRGTGQHLSREQTTDRAIDVLRETRPGLLLVVRGDALTDRFWQAVADARIPAGIWFYDELTKMDQDLPQLADRARIASYSAADVRQLVSQGIPALHVPLAFDPGITVRHRPYDATISFIGARYPKREALLHGLVERGLPVRAYGRDWSDHPVDRLRTWRTSSIGVPNGRDLPLAEGYGVMHGSAATLNIHGAQDGFTMRTFEACGVGAVQLIDRSDVADLYEPGTEILVFKNEDELTELCRKCLADTPEMRRLREQGRRRTLDSHTFRHRAHDLEALWAE
ncbi:hypothetical protein SDC9_124674 [bioreactor metagenome]|uniref:Spore protein YkvP/CgeB glycosyl transferase-like domain-containing protein n=2 Tax=root TaxID=1 RepID=A0A645CL26_9ZZZZ